jgi:hypothetical protein
MKSAAEDYPMTSEFQQNEIDEDQENKQMNTHCSNKIQCKAGSDTQMPAFIKTPSTESGNKKRRLDEEMICTTTNENNQEENSQFNLKKDLAEDFVRDNYGQQNIEDIAPISLNSIMRNPNAFTVTPKSPNIRTRWLMNDKIFEGQYMSAYALPQTPTEVQAQSKDNNNPFQDISTLSRLPSEMELEPALTRNNSSIAGQLDYSKSPLLLMRNNSQVAEELSNTKSHEDLSFALNRTNSLISTEETSRLDRDFEVIAEIGKGYFGNVKKCRNRFDGLEYAIKVTKLKQRGDKYKQEALQEMFALSALSVCDDNPFVVKYFNSWIESSHLYVVVIFIKLKEM